MASAAFVLRVVMKLIMWALMALGLYVALRLLLDGRWGWALLLVFIIIPFAHTGVAFVLYAVTFLLYPIASLTGRRRELTEFKNFEGAVLDSMGTDLITLRSGKRILDAFHELPPPAEGEPPRSGEELIALYNQLHQTSRTKTPSLHRAPSRFF